MLVETTIEAVLSALPGVCLSVCLSDYVDDGVTTTQDAVARHHRCVKMKAEFEDGCGPAH